MRTFMPVTGGFALLLGLFVPACSTSTTPADPDETGCVDCGGDGTADGGPARPIEGEGDPTCGADGPKCEDGKACTQNEDCASAYCNSQSQVCETARIDDGILNGAETDIDCGGPDAPKCDAGKKCLADSDCTAACGYTKTCVEAPSCKPHLGGDTCGVGEVGQTAAVHESCCRSLPVPGYSDPAHPGKQVYLDKYEITAGRVRAFIDDITAKHAGQPNVRAWITANTPPVWDASWNKYLPADFDGETIIVPKNLLGDPRPPAPDRAPVPPTDEPRKTGLDFQFNGQLFVYLHGNNCGTRAPTSFGFPTWFYPAAVLAKMGPEYPPRADGKDFAGALIPASEHLEVKSMNCITNAMLAAFCHWDGGQLATDDVLDYVTASPPALGDKPGCGTQIGTEDPPETPAAMTGGRCADLAKINATYDAGGSLPEPNHPRNVNNYMYPYFPDGNNHDKAWEIAGPGRGSLGANGEQADVVRIAPGDEPWVDLAGNLNEAVLKMDGATFTGRFGLKYRGIGYQSARSVLNTKDDWEGEGGIRRIERPEAKAAFAGGRCMRFK